MGGKKGCFVGLKSNQLIMAISALAILGGAPTADAGSKKANALIHVYDSAQLQQAMQPANAGKNILVHAGNYAVSASLVVPDGATVRGEGKMRFDRQGIPEGFAAGSGTNLVATTSLAGDMVILGDGALIENVLIQDIDGGPSGACTSAEINTCAVTPDRQRCCPRNRGNLIFIGSQTQNDEVSAAVNECELVNPNFSGIGPSGPIGRGVAVLNRNLGLGAPPDAFTDSAVSATVLKSVIHAQRGGSSIFAINFAARSSIDLLLIGNRFEGNLDANGGVSRPDRVDHSTTSIASIGNLYRPSVPGTIDAWTITGGSGAPLAFPVPPLTTEFNKLEMFSLNDRIEDCYGAVVAVASQRFFSEAQGVGPSSNNSLELQLYGTRFKNNEHSDLYLIGARSNDDYPTGDNNVLSAVIFAADGDDNPGNVYADTAYGEFDLELSPENQGVGNGLEILGSLRTFLFTNDGFDDSAPPAEFFTRGR